MRHDALLLFSSWRWLAGPHSGPGYPLIFWLEYPSKECFSGVLSCSSICRQQLGHWLAASVRQMKRWNMNHARVSTLQFGQIFQCQRCLWLFFSRPCRDMLCDQRWKCSATNGFGASSKPLGQDFEILNCSMESRRTMISNPNKSTWKGLEGFTAII